MNCKNWEIVYIKFPFTDLSNYKLRPALIISNSEYNKKDNVILIWIFWNEWIKEFSMNIEEDDLKSWKMLKISFLRFQNIFTLDKKLIERKIGEIKKKKLNKVIEKIQNYIKLN